jgi:DNA-binding NarL/FixJ family response regulator
MDVNGLTCQTNDIVEAPRHAEQLPDEHVMRVLIVDDQRAFVESMAIVIDSREELTCVGVARNGTDGIDAARRHQPDIVLMDVGLPDIDGVEATAVIVDEIPGVRVVMLTGRPDATVLARAAAAGASAFLLKDSSIDEIVEAMHAVPSQTMTVDRSALAVVLGADSSHPAGVDELTQRELEVLGALATGHQPKQIARQLGITLPTCRGYIKSLFQKLGAHSALEAVVLAHRYGLIRLPDPTD